MRFSTTAIMGFLPAAMAANSAGCGKSAPSSGTKSISVDGTNRQYILTVPSNYNPNTPYKLIVGYHWLNGNMQDVVNGNYYGLKPLSNNGAIFVAPNGINSGWGNEGQRDLKFTDALVAYIEANMCVDADQLYALGWSYGGAMSFEVACARPSKSYAFPVTSPQKRR